MFRDVLTALMWVALIDSMFAAPPVSPLMDGAKHERLRREFPHVDDVRVQEILSDSRLLIYTNDEIPMAYQDWNAALPGIHSPSYNISADRSERFGNGNREFPWGAPAGTHRSPGVSTVKFLWLPTDDAGETLPVVWYRTRLRGDNRLGYAWMFPVGSVLGELLLIERPGGGRLPFELRTRTREAKGWDADVFRPFPRAVDLAERIVELRPDWQSDLELVRLVRHLAEPQPLALGALFSRHPTSTAFFSEAFVDSLPPVADSQLIESLLATTGFRSVLGIDWRQDSDGQRVAAPTTEAAFHVVPQHFDGGFVEVDNISCMRCHESVNQHVRDFDFSRDWYGRVRGSDGIFSFHPFAAESISHNGFFRPVSMHAGLTAGGFVAPYDAAAHPERFYVRIKGLDE
jgi:hypothetical protein